MRTTALLALALALPAAFPARTQTLLVVNQGNATLSLIDPATNQQIAAIPENTPGVHAHEAAVTPDGRTAFLPIYGSTGVGKPGIDGAQMLILDLPSRTITARIDFPHPVRPHQPTYDPATHLLYVTTELDQAITVIDPKTHAIVGHIPTGQPESHMLAISHRSHRGYTANVGPGTVSVLDLAARKTLTIIPVAPTVQRISISNDDSLVFTSDYAQPRLAVIDTATNKIKTFIPLPGLGYGSAPTPDGHYLLLAIPTLTKPSATTSGPTGGQVAVIDLHTLTVTRTIDVPAAPQEILIPPASAGHPANTAYVSCNTSGKVAVLDLPTLTLRTTITAGPGADGLAWAK
jgi:YVTN family beta-propeller protein